MFVLAVIAYHRNLKPPITFNILYRFAHLHLCLTL